MDFELDTSPMPTRRSESPIKTQVSGCAVARSDWRYCCLQSQRGIRGWWIAPV